MNIVVIHEGECPNCKKDANLACRLTVEDGKINGMFHASCPMCGSTVTKEAELGSVTGDINADLSMGAEYYELMFGALESDWGFNDPTFPDILPYVIG
jgi:hypothetical protein